MLREQVIKGILHELPGQTFSFKRLQSLWTPDEAERFERELEYLAEKYTMDEIVDGYVYTTETTMEERKYFQEHGDYRCHSFAEINKLFYSNPEATTRRMIGLCLCEYLWETVLLTHRFFEKAIREAEGENYLEIGPGHGKYFYEAYNLGRFKKYVGVDVSPTSIALTDEFMRKHINGDEKAYELYCQDATLLDPEKEKYDFVTIQEVLEHLEDPEGMLRKIGELLTPEGRAYALMPICAPSPQHIFLFQDRAHVRSIVDRAGLEIVKEEYITANNMPAEEAEAKRLPIDAALIVKRKK